MAFIDDKEIKTEMYKAFKRNGIPIPKDEDDKPKKAKVKKTKKK